jgi:predicted RNA-binding Zn-ribbon protein involved in translation (DUF1610 family)
MAEGDIMEEKKKMIKILYCNECAEPLEFKSGKTGLCPNCGITPSPHEIFIERLCPGCNIRLKELASGDEYFCPSCNQVYVA